MFVYHNFVTCLCKDGFKSIHNLLLMAINKNSVQDVMLVWHYVLLMHIPLK